jgi:hypothetical protein
MEFSESEIHSGEGVSPQIVIKTVTFSVSEETSYKIRYDVAASYRSSAAYLVPPLCWDFPGFKGQICHNVP